MSTQEMLADMVRAFDTERDALAVVEVGRRQWRCFHLQVTDAGRPKLTDVTELVALGGELRPPTRGRGSQPIASDFGIAIARKVASVTGLSLHAQVEGVDRFEGRCEPC
jgi:hypothetical protein